jgi:SAM-dependent methyltransferase
MTEPRKVEAYFSDVAAGYHAASEGRVWGAVRRREARAVEALLGPLEGRDVLELGCGAGFYTRRLLARGARHVHAIDVSERMLAQLPGERVTPILGDAAAVDAGRRFDVMLSAGMLEFVPDPAAALRNAARHAAPGARLVILYPTRSVLGGLYRRFHRRHGLSISLFDRPGIEELARASGWLLETIVRAGPYSATARLVRGPAT